MTTTRLLSYSSTFRRKVASSTVFNRTLTRTKGGSSTILPDRLPHRQISSSATARSFAKSVTTNSPKRQSAAATFSSAVNPTSEDDFHGEGAVTNRLNDLIAKGEIQPDGHQLAAAEELDRIYDYLMSNDPPPLTPTATPSDAPTTKKSFFGGLFGASTPTAADVSQRLNSLLPFLSANKGAYMFGGVGCGKTFLMNLLYDAVDMGPWAKDKQKVHFHKFMLQVHQHMHEQRKIQPFNADLIAPVVDEILKQGRFLCLDEFQVTDVADALILQRLFEGLWSKGCILVATSNRPPRDLYLHGLQRDRFLPFIDRLEQRCAVVDLLDSETDYRLLANATSEDGTTNNSSSRPIVYFTKGGAASSKECRTLFYKLAEGHPTNPTTLSTQGRTVPIPLACTQKKIAFFDFADLCQKAMGAADYLVIANNFSTVFIHNVPKLTVNELNWLRRFITFVDTMYELRVTLILHTARPVEGVHQLFTVHGDKNSYSQDEVFAFDRTLSRLEEMSSPKYLKSQWLGGSKKRRSKSSERWLFRGLSSSSNDADEDAKERVTTRLSIHPSLDNHHGQTTLNEAGTLDESYRTRAA